MLLGEVKALKLGEIIGLPHTKVYGFKLRKIKRGYEKIKIVKRKNKCAQAHVELIISFVLFVGALLFIFILINPFSKADEKISVINKVQEEIIKNISSEIGKLSVIGNTGLNSYIFPSTYGNNFVEVQETFSNPIKCQLYFSDDFGTGTQTCQFVTYTLGVYSKEEMIVWSKVVLLKQNYESNYRNVKSSLEILNDFSFSFKNIGGEKIGTLSVLKNPPVGVNVESKDFVVRVIDSSGDIKELILNIKVW